MTLSVVPRGPFLLMMMLNTIRHVPAIRTGHYTDKKAAIDETVALCELLAAEAAAETLVRAMQVAETPAGVMAADGVDRW